MQEPKQAFSNFFLFGLSHLKDEDLFGKDGKARKSQKKELKKRIELGKKAILENTKKGDLIAFESPELRTFAEFYEQLWLNYNLLYGKNAERIMRYHWNSLGRDAKNFYYSLAEYARRIGRKTISLETRTRRAGSKTLKAYFEDIAFPVPGRRERLEFLNELGVDAYFARRIQKHKPKMVVVANAHAAYLERQLKPRKVLYYPRTANADKKQWLAYVKTRARLYREKKLKRLKKQREEIRRRKQALKPAGKK